MNQTRQNVVLLDDGSELLLSEVVHKVSRSIYLTKMHLEICERLARNRFPDPDLNKIYVNLLFTKSEKAKQLTALAILIKIQRLKVIKIKSDFIKPDFKDILEHSIMIEYSGNGNSSLLDPSIRITYFVKILLNSMYRLFRKKNLSPTKTVVQAWDSQSEKLHGETLLHALLLLYPVHPVRFKRNLKFYMHCFLSYGRVSFYGLPYRFRDLMRILAHRDTLDETLVKVEYDTQLNHAMEICRLTPCTFLTSDQESGIGSFVLFRYLSSQNCRTICLAHGVGLSCPNVFYDEYQLITPAQLEFFSLRNRDVHFILNMDYKSQGKSGLRISLRPRKLFPIVIFVHQGFAFANQTWYQKYVYEAEFETKAISHAYRVCESMGLDFRVKPHPRNGLGEVIKELEVDIMRNIKDLDKKHPIFINIDSTAFFDFRLYGPTLFLGTELFNCSLTMGFGHKLQWIQLNQLEKAIQKLLCPDEWYKAYLLQNRL